MELSRGGFVREVMSFGYPIPVRFLTPLVVLYVWVQAGFPDIERRLYWGELLVLLLLPSIVRAKYRHPGQRKILPMVYFMLFVIPITSVLYTLTFWSEEYDSYFLLRHLSMFHYIVFFFFAYTHAEDLVAIMSRFFWVALLFLVPQVGAASLGYSLPMFGFSMSSIGVTVLFGWLYLGYVKRCENYRPALMAFTVLVASILLIEPRSTNIVITVTLLSLLPFAKLLKYWHGFVPLPVRRLLVGIVVIAFVGGTLSILAFLGREVHENILYKIELEKIPELGGVNLGPFESTRAFSSSLWRLSYWGYLTNRFLEYPLGIGLGTPMFELGLRQIMTVGVTETVGVEYQSFTMSAHNFFIALLVRLGVIFLIPFVVFSLALSKMLSQYWRSCRYRPFSTRESRVVFGSIIAFIVVVIEAMFNVVVETPLYAALFWFSFGLMTRLVGDYIAANRWSHPKVVTALRTA